MPGPRDQTYLVVWLGYASEEIATDTIMRHDLTDALVWAANRLSKGKGHGKYAQGVYVEHKEG